MSDHNWYTRVQELKVWELANTLINKLTILTFHICTEVILNRHSHDLLHWIVSQSFELESKSMASLQCEIAGAPCTCMGYKISCYISHNVFDK